MYCHNCGKDIPNGSNYCPNCGSKLRENKNFSFWGMRFSNIYYKHKKLTISYAIWVLLHISLWIFSNPTRIGRGGHEYVISDAFYPFNKPLKDFLDSKFSFIDNIDVYDFSEFFFYIVLLPLMLLGIIRLLPYLHSKINLHRISIWLKMHMIQVILYVAWVVIHLTIYFSSPIGWNCNKEDFYPFHSSFVDDTIALNFSRLGSYDSSELLFYTLLLPILLVCIEKLIKILVKSKRISNGGRHEIKTIIAVR